MDFSGPNGTNGTLTLHDCVKLLRGYLETEWMRAFLLGTSGTSSDLSILTSKTHMQHAFVGNKNIEFCPLGDSYNSYHHLFTKNILMLPAFCFGNYSAVIITEERLANSDVRDDMVPGNMRGIGHPRHMFGHGILDETSGTLVIVYSEDSTRARIMIHTRDRVTKYRQRAGFRIDKCTLEGGKFDEIADCIEVFTLISEVPACMVCVPGNMCVCEQPKTLVPSHPLDLATVSNNLKLLTGVYSGTFSRGFMSAPISVIGGLTGAQEPGKLSKRLHSWTISYALTKYFANSAPEMPLFSIQLVATAQQMIAENIASMHTKKISLTCTTDDTTNDNNTSAVSTVNDPFRPNTSADNLSLGPFSSLGDINIDVGDLIVPPVTTNPDSFLVSTQPPTNINTPPSNGRVALPARPPPRLAEKDKDAIRKIRNRESAARSNMKKRLKIAAIQKEIDQGKDCAAKLKEKLETLQRVNRTLRREIERADNGTQLIET